MDTKDTIETVLHAPNISVSVLFGTVKIEIECSDDYAAQVLFDDLVDRLEAGQEISITPTPKPPATDGE